MNRRNFLLAAAALPAAAAEPAASLSFSDRAHIFARPEFRAELTHCFAAVLGCTALSLRAPGMAEPILAFKFPGGGSLSVEFTPDALDEEHARFGAWLEIRSGDPDGLKRTILDAGMLQVHHPATNTFYFKAPGGQIFGVVSASNPGGGEMRKGT
jgi:hypothetical protein